MRVGGRRERHETGGAGVLLADLLQQRERVGRDPDLARRRGSRRARARRTGRRGSPAGARARARVAPVRGLPAARRAARRTPRAATESWPGASTNVGSSWTSESSSTAGGAGLPSRERRDAAPRSAAHPAASGCASISRHESSVSGTVAPPGALARPCSRSARGRRARRRRAARRRAARRARRPRSCRARWSRVRATPWTRGSTVRVELGEQLGDAHRVALVGGERER